MSFRYSSCFSLRSPNIRSFRTSENPMMALSGVRSSWDMFARNSDLWRLAASSGRLLSHLVKEPGVLDRQGRLGGKAPEQLDRLGREVAGPVAGHREAADQLAFPHDRPGQASPDTGLNQRLSQPSLVGVR